MGKSVSDAVLDAALDAVAASNQVTVCETEPTTFEEANSDLGTGAGKVLARLVLTPGAGGADFGAIIDGTPNGRNLPVNAQSGLDVDTSSAGSGGDHIALTTTGTNTLNYVTTTDAAVPLTAGGTVDVGAWSININDPT